MTHTAELADKFLKAQLAGDRREAVRIAVEDGVNQGLSLSTVHLEIIKPAQYEIGRLWHENVISVAQEHLATAIAQLVLSHLYGYLKRAPSNGRRVLVGCVEGELHELGARMLADLLESDGYDAWYLGPNVPNAHLARMVGEARPDVIALSVTMPYYLPSIRAAIRAIRDAEKEAGYSNPIPIAIGGSASVYKTHTDANDGVFLLGSTAEELLRSFRTVARLSTSKEVGESLRTSATGIESQRGQAQ